MMLEQFPAHATPFQSVKETCRSLGVSQFYLRNGIKDGTVPHIRSGNKILINVPKLLDALNRESEGGTI